MSTAVTTAQSSDPSSPSAQFYNSVSLAAKTAIEHGKGDELGYKFIAANPTRRAFNPEELVTNDGKGLSLTAKDVISLRAILKDMGYVVVEKPKFKAHTRRMDETFDDEKESDLSEDEKAGLEYFRTEYSSTSTSTSIGTETEETESPFSLRSRIPNIVLG